MQEEIKAVKLIYDDGSFENYQLLNLQKVNSKGEISDSKKKAWLPLYKSGKINLFSYDIYTTDQSTGRTEYTYTVTYLNNSKNNFAINPVDLSLLSIFNMSKIGDKIMTALYAAFYDCPEYVALLKSRSHDEIASKFKNVKQQKEAIKKLKEANKDLPKEERRKQERQARSHFFVDPYLDFIAEYEKTCPN